MKKRRLTRGQANIVDTLRRQKDVTTGMAEAFDGRSFWPLVESGVVVIAKTCGCDHPCGCRAYVRLAAQP